MAEFRTLVNQAWPLAFWLLTYWTHVAIIFTCAFLIRRSLRRPDLRDLIWRCSLILPLISASIAVGLTSDNGFPLSKGVRTVIPFPVEAPRVDVRKIVSRNAPPIETYAITDDVATFSVAMIVGLAVILACIAIIQVLRDAVATNGVIERGREISDPVVEQIVREQGFRPLRLVESTESGTPFAWGTNTLCLPAKCYPQLQEKEKRAVISHELEHLRRRDTFWLPISGLLCTVFPLRFLSQRLLEPARQDVELICDGAAVRSAGSCRPLIASFAAFASELESTANRVTISAYADSGLMRRAAYAAAGLHVTREEGKSESSTRVFALSLLLCVVAAMVTLMPAVTPKAWSGVDTHSNGRNEARQISKNVTGERAFGDR